VDPKPHPRRCCDEHLCCCCGGAILQLSARHCWWIDRCVPVIHHSATHRHGNVAIASLLSPFLSAKTSFLFADLALGNRQRLVHLLSDCGQDQIVLVLPSSLRFPCLSWDRQESTVVATAAERSEEEEILFVIALTDSLLLLPPPLRFK
jgi:hypothetical protein